MICITIKGLNNYDSVMNYLADWLHDDYYKRFSILRDHIDIKINHNSPKIYDNPVENMKYCLNNMSYTEIKYIINLAILNSKCVIDHCNSIFTKAEIIKIKRDILNLKMCRYIINQSIKTSDEKQLESKVSRLEEKLNVVTDFMNMLDDYNSINKN